MKVEYDLLFKNGIERTVLQEGTEAEHVETLKIFELALREDEPAVVRMGNGKDFGRLVRVSDLSQVCYRILESASQ